MRHSMSNIRVIKCSTHAIDSLRDHPTSDGSVVAVLPRHHATLRLIELPSQDPVEIEQMAALSATEMVPFDKDEMVLSTAILKKISTNASQVLIAIAHLDVVEQQLELLRAAGIEPQALYLSTTCLLSAIHERPGSNSESPTAYAHIEQDSLDFLVLENGLLRYNRGVEINAAQSNEVITAIEQAIRIYSRENGGLNPNISLEISTACSMPEAFRSDCESRISIAKQTFTSDMPLITNGATILAQSSSLKTIDLLPKSIKDHRTQQEGKRTVLKQIALFAVMLLLIITSFSQAISQRQAYVNLLESEAADLRPVAKAVMQKRVHLQRLQEQVTRSDTPYQHLGRIMAQTPSSGLTFSRFTYDHNDGIVLHGRADSRERFDTLIDQLRMVGKTVYPQFAQAQSIYDRQRTERSFDVWEYAISIEFPEPIASNQMDGASTDE